LINSFLFVPIRLDSGSTGVRWQKIGIHSCHWFCDFAIWTDIWGVGWLVNGFISLLVYW